MAREVSISFKFVVPVEAVLATARRLAASSNQDENLTGSAVVELTDITSQTMAAVEDVASKETYDLAVYFDYRFGNSLEAAKRLLSSPDADVRNVAQSLIDQSDAIRASKAAFQEVAKQSGK